MIDNQSFPQRPGIVSDTQPSDRLPAAVGSNLCNSKWWSLLLLLCMALSLCHVNDFNDNLPHGNCSAVQYVHSVARRGII